MTKRFKELVIIGIIGVLTWTAFSVYFAVTSPPEDDDYTFYSAPISNDFGNNFVEKIHGRVDTHLPVSPDEFKRGLD